jgi:aminomethyltransferase
MPGKTSEFHLPLSNEVDSPRFTQNLFSRVLFHIDDSTLRLKKKQGPMTAMTQTSSNNVQTQNASPNTPVESPLGKKTILFENHLRRGARMVDFSGWQMPLQYSKVLEEHEAVRFSAGLFDISHMGLVSVKGSSVEEAQTFLNQLVPQDLSKLYPGKAVYTQFLNPNGGIIDDIIIYRMPETQHFQKFSQILVICNASNTDLDCQWMKEHAQKFKSTIQIETFPQEFSLFALQGPRFLEIIETKGFKPENLPKRFHVNEAVLDSVPVLLARTGYTGEDGVEIIVENLHTQRLWDDLLAYGEPLGLKPIGLAARDTLRLEAAYPLHGHDISEADSPLEAGLGWSVKLNSPDDFIGKAALLTQQDQGLAKKFYCFKLKKKTIPRQDDLILKNGEIVGKVTSGSISPLLKEPIGMGYIQSGIVSGPGETIQVRVRGADVDAEIVERPFYKAR